MMEALKDSYSKKRFAWLHRASSRAKTKKLACVGAEGVDLE